MMSVRRVSSIYMYDGFKLEVSMVEHLSQAAALLSVQLVGIE